MTVNSVVEPKSIFRTPRDNRERCFLIFNYTSVKSRDVLHTLFLLGAVKSRDVLHTLF